MEPAQRSPTPPGTDPRASALEPEQADRLAQALGTMIAQDLGTERFPNPEGWKLLRASRDYLMSLHVPVAWFELAGRTLNFIVTPRDPSRPCYRRTARFDVTYFSYDEEDDEQAKVYARDRAMIERFADWLARRDHVGSGRGGVAR